MYFVPLQSGLFQGIHSGMLMSSLIMIRKPPK